jgi:hypothetical protein
MRRFLISLAVICAVGGLLGALGWLVSSDASQPPDSGLRDALERRPAAHRADGSTLLRPEGSEPFAPEARAERAPVETRTASSPRVDSPRRSIDWDAVVLDQMGGVHQLGPELAQDLQTLLQGVEFDDVTWCVKGRWTRPPGIRMWDAKLELRLEPVKGGFEIADVILLEANVADADVEECVRRVYEHKVILAGGLPPDLPVRMWYPVRIGVGPRNQEAIDEFRETERRHMEARTRSRRDRP